jgi:hypothetical protein
MHWKRGSLAVLAVIAFALASLLVPALVAVPWLAAKHGAKSSWHDALFMVSFLLHLMFYALYFFGVPQLFLLLWLRATGFWVRLVAGALTGWLFLSLLFLDGLIDHLARQTTGTVTLIGLYVGQVFLRPAETIARFIATFSPATFFFSALIGALITIFCWVPVYRLLGDKRRDWDAAILSGRPPYAR